MAHLQYFNTNKNCSPLRATISRRVIPNKTNYLTQSNKTLEISLCNGNLDKPWYLRERKPRSIFLLAEIRNHRGILIEWEDFRYKTMTLPILTTWKLQARKLDRLEPPRTGKKTVTYRCDMPFRKVFYSFFLSRSGLISLFMNWYYYFIFSSWFVCRNSFITLIILFFVRIICIFSNGGWVNRLNKFIY